MKMLKKETVHKIWKIVIHIQKANIYAAVDFFEQADAFMPEAFWNSVTK